MQPHAMIWNPEALNLESNKIALATCCRMMDSGFRFEDAVAVTTAVLPTVRSVLAGILPADCAVIVELGSNAGVRVYPSEDEAKAVSGKLTSQGIKHIGIAVQTAIRLGNQLKGTVGDECALTIN